MANLQIVNFLNTTTSSGMLGNREFSNLYPLWIDTNYKNELDDVRIELLRRNATETLTNHRMAPANPIPLFLYKAATGITATMAAPVTKELDKHKPSVEGVKRWIHVPDILFVFAHKQEDREFFFGLYIRNEKAEKADQWQTAVRCFFSKDDTTLVAWRNDDDGQKVILSGQDIVVLDNDKEVVKCTLNGAAFKITTTVDTLRAAIPDVAFDQLAIFKAF